jgi:hypothetical protein
MGNRTDDDDTAAGRLGQLIGQLRQRPVTGPEGHSYIASGSHARPTHSPALIDLAGVDHITDSVRELVDYTREVAPDAEPLAGYAQDVYQWAADSTRDAPEEVQQRRATIEYRQRLEHAIAAGDIKVVRPHRCPACRCFGLMWERQQRTVVCTNGNCRTKDGLSRKWSLARLAYEHIAAMSEKGVRDCAT